LKTFVAHRRSTPARQLRCVGKAQSTKVGRIAHAAWRIGEPALNQCKVGRALGAALSSKPTPKRAFSATTRCAQTRSSIVIFSNELPADSSNVFLSNDDRRHSAPRTQIRVGRQHAARQLEALTAAATIAGMLSVAGRQVELSHDRLLPCAQS
jgi:hypothetical protein